MPRLNRPLPAISLFPFLSILASVIGTLTLIIACLTLGQIDQSRAPHMEEDDALVSDDPLVRLARLLRKITPPDRFDPADWNKASAWLEAERERVQRDKVKLQQAIAANRVKPEEPTVLTIEPAGSGPNMKPTFVEATAAGLVLYPGTKEIPRTAIASDKAFADLLELEADRQRKIQDGSAILIFLIRPSGVGTYWDAHTVARNRALRCGRLPLPEGGRLDLSKFLPPR